MCSLTLRKNLKDGHRPNLYYLTSVSGMSSIICFKWPIYSSYSANRMSNTILQSDEITKIHPIIEVTTLAAELLTLYVSPLGSSSSFDRDHQLIGWIVHDHRADSRNSVVALAQNLDCSSLFLLQFARAQHQSLFASR